MKIYKFKKDIKVVILGAFSTGKTTLSETLSEKLGTPLSENKFKTYFSQLFHERKLLDSETKLLNLSPLEALKFERINYNDRTEFERNSKSFISEAGTLTELAYFLVFGQKYKSFPLISLYLQYKYISHALKYYQQIIYLPPEIPIVPDGFRPEGAKGYELRSATDECLVNILKQHNFHYTTIRGNKHQRLKSALDLLCSF